MNLSNHTLATLKLLSLAGTLGAMASLASAHDMMYVGKGSNGHLKIFIEDGLLPNMMTQSIYPEIDGWVQAEFGFETVIGDDPDLDMHPISGSSNIQVVLQAADEGIYMLKDGFGGPLAIGEGYDLGHPYFHLHPLWNILDVDFDRTYSLTFVLHDTTNQYPDSPPFTLTFKCTPCPADFDRSVFVDIDDFTSFVMAFEAGTDDADFDQSGFVDIEDFTGFVLAFEAGC